MEFPTSAGLHVRFSSFFLAAGFAVSAAAGASAQEAAASSGLRIDLNIPAQRVVVWDGDSIIKRYTVSVGQPGHDTPAGSFTIQRAEWNPWWQPPEREWAKDDKLTPPGPDNPMGRVKMFFAPYYYLHGTPKVSELGTPASHGCVRMRNQDAIELATLLHNRANPSVPASAIPGILRNRRDTRWVNFRAPVPITIRYEPVVVERGMLRIYPDIYRHRNVHAEGVYQALLAAGYDAGAVDRAAIRAVLARAAAAKGPYSVAVDEAFGSIPRSQVASAPAA
jgi:murein L,D-transpeptidase YcbB/YkuD